MNKRIVAIVSAIFMTLSAGCGSGNVAVIGGADGPTGVFIAGKGPTQTESQPSDSSAPENLPESSLPESSSESSLPESSLQSSAPESSSQSAPSSSVSDTPAAGTAASDRYTLSTNKVKAGYMMTLTCKDVDNADDIVIETTTSGLHKAFLHGDDAIAYIAVSRNAALGDYTLTVSNGGEKVTLPYSVVDAGFQSQSFQMAESTVNSTVNNDAARVQYNQITADAMALNTGEDYLPDFDSFIMPIDPPNFRISSSYGFTRIVNGKVSGRHEGVDFPAPQGTPIVAAGPGKVIYAGFVTMTGNTVVIEHGMGVKSWYQHMNSIDCQEGDILDSGDPVGTVGTTGYSTGNHLHFGMSIFDTYTDPAQFVPIPNV